ncbi:MAG TPA: sulfatase-like hydrolase/transferase [Bryobacteraceae bacterium]|nr:sulfatase-like hydrolase/transferase [Bryobacteraceae bacterium]
MMRLFSRLAALALICLVCAGAPRETRNIILVTADGLRWQDLFSGMDPMLKDEKSAGMEHEAALKAKFWRPTPEERRSALMPFFWTTIAAKGVVLGNVKKGSSVRVTNAYRVSYPGYSEIFTGRAQDEAIRGNDAVRNPTPTVFEFLRQKLDLDPSQVALFASWEMFQLIGEHQPGSIVINAGYRDYEGPNRSARMRELSAMQFQVFTPWTEERHDYITFEMALEYMKLAKPRVLHIAFDETDDWAHDKRYNRVLDAINYLDRCLAKLWDTIQDLPEYRGKTTFIVTADHGRGGTLKDWDSHGKEVAGAQQIWMAIAGPDTPAAGEAANVPEIFQRDVAPTMIDLMGVDYHEYAGVLGKPIALALPRTAQSQ